tara:strand:- start:854 stop:1105 length:252 start_codon:yes stop_codon:yes gene_type:complete
MIAQIDHPLSSEPVPRIGKRAGGEVGMELQIPPSAENIVTKPRRGKTSILKTLFLWTITVFNYIFLLIEAKRFREQWEQLNYN